MPTDKQRARAAERQRRFIARRAEAHRAEQAAKGLPPVPPIPTMPSRERWNALQEQARASLQTMVEEMQSYHDDRSEAWQEIAHLETRLDKGRARRQQWVFGLRCRRLSVRDWKIQDNGGRFVTISQYLADQPQAEQPKVKRILHLLRQYGITLN